MSIKIFVVSLFFINIFGSGFPYYYYDIKSPRKQKKEFMKILLPLVARSNKHIKKERKFVKNFFKIAEKNDFRGLDVASLKKLIYLYHKYHIKQLFDKRQYLKKIDTVPVSLALAQGAIESGWGKSRFVLEANNIFGHWTYSGNGLIPTNRDEGKTHMIRIFNSLQSSVNAYVLNLNRNSAYKDFRNQRKRAHDKNKIYNGLMASKTMIHYSSLKEK